MTKITGRSLKEEDIIQTTQKNGVILVKGNIIYPYVEKDLMDA